VRRLAVYAQDEWSPLPALDLYLGLRWESLRTRTDGRDMQAVANRSAVWSPVTHLLWRLPGQRGQLRMALARSYRAPATRDLVPRRYTVNNANGPANPHFQGNPALRPELAWGVELAYERYFGSDSMFSTSAYQRRIADVILPFLFQDRGEWISTPRNSGLAVTRGIELDGRATFGASGATARVTLSRNWSRVAAIPGPGNRLGEQVPWVLNAGIDWQAQPGLSMGFNWNVKGGDNARTAHLLWNERATERRLDLHGNWQVRRGLVLRLSAANLLAPPALATQRFEDGPHGVWRSTSSSGERVVRLAADLAL
jgi:outer membrane receptor protein involved in Fe transport